MIEMNLQIRNRLTDLKNELMVAAEWETGVRDLGSLDGQVHTTTLQVDNQQEPTAQHMELCSMLRGSLDGRAVWGRIDTCKCMAEVLHCSSETTTTLLIVIPQYKIQSLKFGGKTNKQTNKNPPVNLNMNRTSPGL